MRVTWAFTGIVLVVSAGWSTPARAASVPAEGQSAAEEPSKLVREVIYNELHDHDSHGFWRYWVQRQSAKGLRVEEQVETCDGPITRAVVNNGKPLDEQGKRVEEARLRELMASPSQQASHRQAFQEDETRIGHILALLPDAFLYEDAGNDNGLRHMRFHPNPAYSIHSIEARIFHAMSGDLWVDPRMKRLAKLEGRLTENVDFGFGLFGRLYKGGWFRLQRTQVSNTDWKTERLEVHMSGRAMLFKTVARETSEVRGGFEPVPPQMSLEQGLRVLHDERRVARTFAMIQGRMAPVALFVNK